MVHHNPVFRSIVVMDVAASGTRDDQLLLSMRHDLRGIVLDCLAVQGISLTDVHLDDLGDGLRLIVSPEVSPALLLDPFVPNLARGLRMHRKTTASAGRLRLRVAIHIGLLYRDGDGWTGTPLVHAARLVDATPVRATLRELSQAELVLVVSKVVFDTLVRHGFGLDQSAYRAVEITEKETHATAWIHVPDHAPLHTGLTDRNHTIQSGVPTGTGQATHSPTRAQVVSGNQRSFQ